MLVPLLLLALSGVAPSAIDASAAPAAARADPPVRVWFNLDGNFAFGDRAKVYAKSEADGYLIVLRADPEGRVRVVFPLDPTDDQRITGGKKYELKSRGGREAFIATDSSGYGTVVAAVSPSPFRTEEFVRDGHWDVRSLSSDLVRDDAEAGLLDLVRRMKADEPFEYDVETYVVSEQYSRRLDRYPRIGAGWGWGYWGYHPFWGFRYRRGWWP